MASFIRNPKDFLSGVMFLAIGGAAVVIAQDYPMGQAVRMGPGYFPVVLGVLLCLIGAACVLRSLLAGGPPVGRLALKPLVLVTVSTLLFGLLLRNAGLLAALAASILLSSLASSKFSAKAAVLTVVLLSAFCYLVFLKALGLPAPLVGPWLGG